MSRDNLTPSYNDNDWMPFGKYGPKSDNPHKLAEVPASYLHWIYSNRAFNGDKKLENYILNNLQALKEEYSDGIWS